MHIHVFLNQWWWQGKQRSLKPLKASPRTDTCQTTPAVRQVRDWLMVNIFLPHPPVQESMSSHSGEAALWPQPSRPQHSFSTTLAWPQARSEFGWWEHKCRQWSHLHSKTRLPSSWCELIYKMKQGKHIWSLGTLSVLCNSMFASALRSYGGKGNVRNPIAFVVKIKIQKAL